LIPKDKTTGWHMNKEAMGFACHQSQRATGTCCAALAADLMCNNPEKNKAETQPVKAAL
jgi:hypothetical protein